MSALKHLAGMFDAVIMQKRMVFVRFFVEKLQNTLKTQTFANTNQNPTCMSRYSKDTIDKIGNSIIYLSERISYLSKTKLLKLLYILERDSIVKFTTPFFGIKFEVWQAGPVAKDIYIDLGDKPILLQDYITTELKKNGGEVQTYVKAKKEFNDDEFSENDIKLMDNVIKTYGNKTAQELVSLLHKKDTAWHAAAEKNGLIADFNSGKTNSSNVEIDFTHYLTGCQLEEYLETKDIKDFFEGLKS